MGANDNYLIDAAFVCIEGQALPLLYRHDGRRVETNPGEYIAHFEIVVTNDTNGWLHEFGLEIRRLGIVAELDEKYPEYAKLRRVDDVEIGGMFLNIYAEEKPFRNVRLRPRDDADRKCGGVSANLSSEYGNPNTKFNKARRAVQQQQAEVAELVHIEVERRRRDQRF